MKNTTGWRGIYNSKTNPGLKDTLKRKRTGRGTSTKEPRGSGPRNSIVFESSPEEGHSTSSRLRVWVYRVWSVSRIQSNSKDGVDDEVCSSSKTRLGSPSVWSTLRVDIWNESVSLGPRSEDGVWPVQTALKGVPELRDRIWRGSRGENQRQRQDLTLLKVKRRVSTANTWKFIEVLEDLVRIHKLYYTPLNPYTSEVEELHFDKQ